VTLDAFLKAEVEEGCRDELARGVLEVTNVPNDPHGQFGFNLYRSLAIHDQAHPGQIHRTAARASFSACSPR
jgi:hypothetical protein